VTIELAINRPDTLPADTIGAAWLAVARRILADGIASRYDEQPVREISLVTLVVARPVGVLAREGPGPAGPQERA
jgi:hypothetical protein